LLHDRDQGHAAGPARGRELASVKVLAMSSYGRLGGAELALSEFVVHRPADVEVEVLLLEDGPLRARLNQRAVSTWVARRDLAGRPSASTLVRFSGGLLALLRDAAPDVVVAFGLKAAIMGVPACRLAGVPLVWYKVDFSLDDLVTRPLGLAVNGVVSVSEAVSATLGPLRDRRLLAVVGPPCRLPRELHLTPSREPLAIGTLGTLTPIKGHRHLIEAAALLSEDFPDLRVLIAGLPASNYPGFAEELRALADSLGIGERLELLGFVEDVSMVLARLTVFVSATYQDEAGYGQEGLSGAMIEASWAGLPVVATRCGGSPEGLLDGVTGTLVDPSDPRALARAITPFLRDEELARRTGGAGSQLARSRFAPDTVAAELFAALRDVL
jgi:glycosyltransferase involved in cell wall biosynthesis